MKVNKGRVLANAKKKKAKRPPSERPAARLDNRDSLLRIWFRSRYSTALMRAALISNEFASPRGSFLRWTDADVERELSRLGLKEA